VVYGPYRQPARDQFVNWLCNLQIQDEDLWLLIGDFNFYRFVENRNKVEAIFMIPWSSITLSVTLAWLNCLLKGEVIPGVICRKSLFFNRLAGSSHLLHGPLYSLYRLSCLLLGSLLIIFLAECKLVLMSLKPISFVLRTTGLAILNVLNRLKMSGVLITTLTIVLILLVLNLRIFEEYSSIGLKASQTSLNSLPIAI
jgi:hypothetical protein